MILPYHVGAIIKAENNRIGIQPEEYMIVLKIDYIANNIKVMNAREEKFILPIKDLANFRVIAMSMKIMEKIIKDATIIIEILKERVEFIKNEKVAIVGRNDKIFIESKYAARKLLNEIKTHKNNLSIEDLEEMIESNGIGETNKNIINIISIFSMLNNLDTFSIDYTANGTALKNFGKINNIKLNYDEEDLRIEEGSGIMEEDNNDPGRGR